MYLITLRSNDLLVQDLSHNCLRSVPADLALLKLLRVLNLRKNLLDQFPSGSFPLFRKP